MDLPRAVIKLPMKGYLAQEVKNKLEEFVCLRYCPKGVCIKSIPDQGGICSANNSLKATHYHLLLVHLRNTSSVYGYNAKHHDTATAF